MATKYSQSGALLFEKSPSADRERAAKIKDKKQRERQEIALVYLATMIGEDALQNVKQILAGE